MKEIILKFDNTIKGLAGYNYGQKIYIEQVKNKIDFNDDLINIVFPNNIIRVASSFVQGFFEEIVKNNGISSIGKKINIKCNNEELKKSIIDNL